MPVPHIDFYALTILILGGFGIIKLILKNIPEVIECFQDIRDKIRDYKRTNDPDME